MVMVMGTGLGVVYHSKPSADAAPAHPGHDPRCAACDHDGNGRSEDGTCAACHAAAAQLMAILEGDYDERPARLDQE